MRETWLERHGVALTILLVVVFLLALPLIWQYWLAPTVFEQNRQSGQDIARDSLDSDKAIQDYRWFRQQWYDIQAQRQQLENYREEEQRFHNQTWPDDGWRDHRDARTRHGRMHDRIAGTENILEQMIADYNARQSDATRAIFQCGLPYNVDEKLFIADASGVEYTSQEAMDKTPPENPEECKFSQDP